MYLNSTDKVERGRTPRCVECVGQHAKFSMLHLCVTLCALRFCITLLSKRFFFFFYETLFLIALRVNVPPKSVTPSIRHTKKKTSSRPSCSQLRRGSLSFVFLPISLFFLFFFSPCAVVGSHKTDVPACVGLGPACLPPT